MCSQIAAGHTFETKSADEVICRLRNSVRSGNDWPVALLETMAHWTDPESVVNGRHYQYFIGGEAFDWLLLAERLCPEIAGLAPDNEIEDLLLTGQLPRRFEEPRFKELLGVEKYRGYLNYYYGVTVEEALQVAVETEIVKRLNSNGYMNATEVSDEAFSRIYQTPRVDLLKIFRKEHGISRKRRMSLEDAKEFTYWLFKLRLETSDKAKIASDTRKGLDQLARMRAYWHSRLPVSVEARVPQDHRLSPEGDD